MKNKTNFCDFLNKLTNSDNTSLIEAIQKGYQACFEQGQELDLNKALATVNNPKNEEFITKLKNILKEKFKLVETELKTLLRPAARGERKGMLIFPAGSANKIYDIQDEFVKYIVRSIYDNYDDIRKGYLFKIHMNQLFGGDFMMNVVEQINEKVGIMQQKKRELRELYKRYWSVICEEGNKFESHPLYRNKDKNNVFNLPQGQPFWDALKQFKAKVKQEHPRVPDDKMMRYIDNDYNYRKELEDIKENFLKTFPEYIEHKEKVTKHFADEHADTKIMDDQIKEELTSVNYDEIRKTITALIDAFVQHIAVKIIANDIF